MASQNRNIVNNYAFWEIRGGGTARFWEEEWQQRNKMASIHDLQSIHQKTVREGREHVRDYWKEGETDKIWRMWRKPEEWDENIDQEQQGKYIKELESRKIKARLGLDILRWGKSTRGAFTVKEAYYLATHQEREEEAIEWEEIWNNKWWPNIAIFVWLVGKERILMWDKIQRR